MMEQQPRARRVNERPADLAIFSELLDAAKLASFQ